MEVKMLNGRFPAASFKWNLRGEEIIKCQALADFFAGPTGFSVAIAEGRGELTFKRVNGKWHQRVSSCDKVFGFMNGAWSAVRAA